MSEESTQTNISSLNEEADGDEPVVVRQHPLPWVLFGIAAVLLALVGGLLARRLSVETRRANEEIEKSAGLKAQLAQLQKYQEDVDAKIAAAETKAKEAETTAVDAATKLKAVEAERDKALKDVETLKKGGTVAAAEPPKKAEPPPKKGKKAVKKKKRR